MNYHPSYLLEVVSQSYEESIVSWAIVLSKMLNIT